MSDPLPYVVVASLQAKPGEGDALLDGLRQHAANCLRLEPDCLTFDVSRDAEQADLLMAYEVYRNRDGFEHHRTSEHFAWFVETFGHLIAGRTLNFLNRVQSSVPRAKKILVTAKPLHRYPGIWTPLVDAGFDVELHDGPPLRSAEQMVDALQGVVATIASIEPYDAQALAKLPDLKVIARFGVGFDQVDLEAASQHDIAVAMTFGANHEAVADHAFGMLAAIVHNLLGYDAKVRRGEWGTNFHGRLSGMTAGVVGFGRIGRAFAKRCQGFNMRVLVSDPLMDAASVSRLGFELVEPGALYSQADFVSLHAPLDPSTHHLIDAKILAAMKPGAILVNTARGAIIDEQALITTLNSGDLFGAALDVFEQEPLGQSPLFEMDNVLLSPHVAGLSEWAVESMGARCVSNILAILDGQDPGGGMVLNPETLKNIGIDRPMVAS